MKHTSQACLVGGILSATTMLVRRATTLAPVRAARSRYPAARRTTDIDVFHAKYQVANPYSYLEDPDSSETKAFVAAQNVNAKKYFSKVTTIPVLQQRMKELYNYPKFGTPFVRGDCQYFFENNGLEAQYRLMQTDLEGKVIKCILDPNKLREDGTAALRAYEISKNGQYLVYGVSYGGSDWFTIFVRDIATGKDLQDKIEWCKFSGIEFDHQGTGFYYNCYPPPEGMAGGEEGGTETAAAQNQMVKYHTIGESDATNDVLIYQTPEHPEWMFGTTVTHDGNYLLISNNDSCDPVNRLYIHSLVDKDNSGTNEETKESSIKQVVKAVDHLKAKWEYLYNIGTTFWFVTNLNAPKNKIVQVTLPEGSMLYDNVEAAEQAFEEKNLIEIVAETGNVLETAQVVAKDVVVLRYLVDCKHELFMVHLKDGGMIQKIDFPTIGTVLGITGRPIDENIYFKVYNFVSPGTIYKCDVSNKEHSKVVQYRETVLEGFDPSLYIVEQRFATSKDGVTQVPMFIVRQKETNKLADKKGKSCLLYGYGGFNISLTPSFSTFRLSFLEQGGTYVMANIRGGGEYGDDWHNAGTVPNGSKQNVFDDFIACGEWLVENGYTTPEQLCIQGGSNGGLLVAACCNQRPDLFSAGVAQVGVMDMLKFQRYTIGNAWCSDFGNADKNEEDYKKLIQISPIHNVRVPTGPNVQYPSMLLTTGDHDDRVVPLHTLKLLAELQYTIGRELTQTNPLLGRISVNEGHGAGKPTKKIIEEQADIYGFVLEATKVGGGGVKSSSL